MIKMSQYHEKVIKELNWYQEFKQHLHIYQYIYFFFAIFIKEIIKYFNRTTNLEMLQIVNYWNVWFIYIIWSRCTHINIWTRIIRFMWIFHFDTIIHFHHFFTTTLSENRLVTYAKLLLSNMKLINPIQKYPCIFEHK